MVVSTPKSRATIDQPSESERFITELTLDPPNATGDESGPPHKDEDYLILSTVHSAKGQEWDSVFILNVTDGSFPSEFSTDNPQQFGPDGLPLAIAIVFACFIVMIAVRTAFSARALRRI